MGREWSIQTSKHHQLKIQPCPFCGSTAELTEFVIDENQSNYVVCCTSDKKPNNEDGDNCCPMDLPPNGFYMARKIDAVLAWNGIRNFQ